MSVSYVLKPMIQSCDAGQRIPFPVSCQLTITWTSTIKLNTDGLCFGCLANNAWSFKEDLSHLAVNQSAHTIEA